VKNILVIKLRYLGDVLLATPVFQALRERYPDARLTAAVTKGTEEMLKGNRNLDDVLVVERTSLAGQLKFARTLRQRRFDCVVDLTDGDRSAVLAWFSGAPVRIGFNEEHRWRGLLYTVVATPRVDAVHRIAHDLEIVRSLGIEPKPGQPELPISNEEEGAAAKLLDEIAGESLAGEGRPLIMLQPGARYWFKAWPIERFAILADRLADRRSCRVLIGGDPTEREMAQGIRTQAASKPVVLAGRTTVRQYAAILKRCALFVGNDNGPMHMAAALGVPVVALFGPSNPAEWGPRGTHAEVLYNGLDCRGCFHPTCTRGEANCMRQIGVDDVFAAAVRLLVATEPGARHG